MKTSKSNAPFLSYFNDRSSSFIKPLFWVSLSGLLISGVAIYQYWQHPEWLQSNSENLTDSSSLNQEKLPNVSSEELAAAADLDNVDFLIKEIEQNQALSSISSNQNLNQSSKLKKEESEFSRFQKAQRAKLSNSSQSLFGNQSNQSNNYSVEASTGNQEILKLLQPPSFSSYQSSRNSSGSTMGLQQGTNLSQPQIIPNPVGNTYLSNRNSKVSLGSISSGVTTPSSVTTSEVANNNSAIPSTVNSNNPNRSNLSSSNEQQATVSDNQLVTPNVSNPERFIPASSLIQSRAITPPTPITNSVIPSSVNAFSSNYNPYASSYSSVNNFGANGVNNGNGNLANGVNNNVANGFNNNPNSGLGIVNQPLQRPVAYGSTTGFNSIRRENFGATNTTEEDPNSLQNNYRSYQFATPNYNRSSPNPYQLQPQNYLQTGAQQKNSLSSPVGATSTVVGGNFAETNSRQTTTNQPVTAPLGTPKLQPSGFFSNGGLNP